MIHIIYIHLCHPNPSLHHSQVTRLLYLMYRQLLTHCVPQISKLMAYMNIQQSRGWQSAAHATLVCGPLHDLRISQCEKSKKCFYCWEQWHKSLRTRVKNCRKLMKKTLHRCRPLKLKSCCTKVRCYTVLITWMKWKDIKINLVLITEIL
jgi:hypothetical protein